jgi:hypothetical protein
VSVTTVVSSKTIRQLKQKAKQKKRTQSITHTEALEHVALEAGFANWHQVTHANSHLLEAEKALKSGVIIGMDIKDGMNDFDSITGDGTFIYDEFLPMLCATSFRKMMKCNPDPDDQVGRLPAETMTDDEFKEWFQTNLDNNMYFRLGHEMKTSCIQDVVDLLNERSFWPAFYIWFQGHLYEFEKSYEDKMPVFST